MLVLGNSILSLHCAAQAAHGVMLRLAGMSAAAVALVSWQGACPAWPSRCYSVSGSARSMAAAAAGRDV